MLRIQSAIGLRSIVVVSVPCTLLVLVVSVSSAGHHNRYPTYWPGTGTDISYYIDADMPASWQANVEPQGSGPSLATAPWNAVGSGTPNFLFLDYGQVPSVDNPCAVPGEGGIGQEQLDRFGTDTVGIESDCLFTGGDTDRIAAFVISIDSGAGGSSWNESGVPTANEIDMLSVMVHEFGHATGWGGGSDHFADNSSTHCSEDATRRTMCKSVIEGSIWARDLQQTDINTASAAYPH